MEKMVDMTDVTREAIQAVEESGIVRTHDNIALLSMPCS
jgi:ATP-dependent protease HslVU (ClpYQ) ATPase subunit